MSAQGEKSYDVAVVGAGPVGMALSLLLAKEGWAVACLERWPAPYGRPRAVGFDFEAARIFQWLGIVDEALAISEPASGEYDWRNAANERLLVIDHGGTGPSGWPIMSTFSQPQLEAVLSSKIEQTPNITMMRGTEVDALTIDPDGISLQLRRQDGLGQVELGASLAPIRASYVVGCDGANSLVRSYMQTEMVDLGFFYDWLIVDVIPHEEREWIPRSLQICDPARPTTVVSGGPGRRRWEFMVLPGERVEDMNTEATAWRLLERWNLTPDNATLERHTVYTFQARWASSWHEGRLLLAGDAAHLMPPFAGQGLCSGLRDASNLSWKLDLVLRAVAPERLLDTYTEERVRHIQHAINYSVELGKVICVLDPAAAAERDDRMTREHGDPSKVLPPLPKASFESGVVHRDIGGKLLPPAGEIAPQFHVAGANGRGLFDDVVGTAFALISPEPLKERLAADSLGFLETVGCRVIRVRPNGKTIADGDDVIDVDGAYCDELRRLECEAALVRPDGYYFGVAKSATDVDALVTDLKAAIRQAR